MTPEGYAVRDGVSRRLEGLLEFKEVGEFFAQELAAQLRDARAMTTSKLDARSTSRRASSNSAAGAAGVVANLALLVATGLLLLGLA